MFFVISGYLISSIIFSKLSTNRFSFTEFYKKRILRIFPSLLLVLSVTLTFSWFVLLSSEFKQLGKHLAAAAAFTSNFVLWQESGYFDNASTTKPLLHLWSLAIEEQFYILYPLVVWVAWRIRLSFFWLILFLAGASFGINLYFMGSTAIDFYFPLTRFWELMIGALLATGVIPLASIYQHRPLSNLLSFVGAALLFWGGASIIKLHFLDIGHFYRF